MIYLLVEKAYIDYPWCQRTLRGIQEEAKKKGCAVHEIDSLNAVTVDCACVLLVGASREWNDKMIVQCRSKGLHPVILSNQLSLPTNEPVSSVMMDLHSSMSLAVQYLHSLGRYHLALYGVNPHASSDPWRVKRFHELTAENGNVFTLETTAEETFQRFYTEIHRYDGVICVNDYVAVSLIRRLKELAYDIPHKLYIVSYGDMHLSKLLTPSITSISDDYGHFGRAALSICNMIERNECISSVKISLHSKLFVRQTTENRPFDNTEVEIIETPIQANKFFTDLEISNLARLEALFSQCDEIDFELIQLLLKDQPYATMAQKCFISETAVKYRVKKMQKICGFSSRNDLVEYFRQHF